MGPDSADCAASIPKRTLDDRRAAARPGRPKHHPALAAVAEKRAADAQLKIADAITKFAGSMMFVYVHIVIFAVWMIFVEKNPWPKLTLVVSLEAIFLSTFVMIGQNRQASYQQAKADHDFATSEQELHMNTELTQAIHEMTEQLHGQICLGSQRRRARPPLLVSPDVTTRLLFVCSGNICRSPTAEAVMRALVEDAGLSAQFELDSAGTGGWHAGDPPDPSDRAPRARRGIES